LYGFYLLLFLFFLFFLSESRCPVLDFCGRYIIVRMLFFCYPGFISASRNSYLHACVFDANFFTQAIQCEDMLTSPEVVGDR
jgi:hypothetical protein